MTDETLGESPADDALPVESDSSPETEGSETPAANTGTPNVPDKDAIQRRIDKLTWEKGERERREQAALREAEYWRSLAMGKPKEEKPNTPPTLAQHEYDEAKYQAALLEYTKAEARKEALEAIKAEREQEKKQAKISEFKRREAEFIAKNPDYQEKVYSEELPFSEAMAELVAESPIGPEVALHLANNLRLAQQIYGLPPLMAAREIGRIEAMLEKAKEAPKPVISKAPTPPPKIETSATDTAVSVKTTDPESDKLSDEEWVRLENQRMKRKAKRSG